MGRSGLLWRRLLEPTRRLHYPLYNAIFYAIVACLLEISNILSVLVCHMFLDFVHPHLVEHKNIVFANKLCIFAIAPSPGLG